MTGCSSPKQVLPSFLHAAEEPGAYVLDIEQIVSIVDNSGEPISTKIIEDESLGTVHTFDLYPVVVSAPYRGADNLWRVDTWISSGNSIRAKGYIVTITLGYDDTFIEYDLLPRFVFEYLAGNTEKISSIVSDLMVGDQIFVHVIGEHNFTPEDMASIAALGFDYPQLVEGHEQENMAILKALASGRQPPAGEIRGVGLIYRGIR
jgi:hypothetical protein